MRPQNFSPDLAILERWMLTWQEWLTHDPKPDIILVTEAQGQLLSAYEELAAANQELLTAQDGWLAERQALEQRHQHYRALFEQLPFGYAVTDLYSSIREANQAMATLLNYPQAFLVRTPLRVFLAETDIPSFDAHLRRLRVLDREVVRGWAVQLKPYRHAPTPAIVTVVPGYNAQGQLVELRWIINADSASAPLAVQAQETIEQRTAWEQQVHELRAELRTKELLLKEIHHRVKNTFQIVSSLLTLQSNQSPDPHLCDALNQSQARKRPLTSAVPPS